MITDNNQYKQFTGNRKEITQELSILTEKYINPRNDTRIYYAKEVTLDAYTSKAIRVDYMQFKPVNNTIGGIEKGDFICYEIKSSVDDFFSGHGHNFIGDLNYFVMPYDVYNEVKDKIPYFVGVKCPNAFTLSSVKKAHRTNRKFPTSELLLMMFRSSNRTNIKIKREINNIERDFDTAKAFRLPFKVGDTVYLKYPVDDKAIYNTAEIEKIILDEKGLYFEWVVYDYFKKYDDEITVLNNGGFRLEDIGKDIFKTSYERNKALEKEKISKRKTIAGLKGGKDNGN